MWVPHPSLFGEGWELTNPSLKQKLLRFAVRLVGRGRRKRRKALAMAVEHLVRGQREEHEVRRTAAQHVLHLLPEEAEVLQLGKVGADERGAADDTAGNVA